MTLSTYKTSHIGGTKMHDCRTVPRSYCTRQAALAVVDQLTTHIHYHPVMENSAKPLIFYDDIWHSDTSRVKLSWTGGQVAVYDTRVKEVYCTPVWFDNAWGSLPPLYTNTLSPLLTQNCHFLTAAAESECRHFRKWKKHLSTASFWKQSLWDGLN